MRYRIYYNRTDDHPISWCFDEGNISSQVRVSNIFIANTLVTFHSKPAKAKLPPNEPYGWVEVDCDKVDIIQGTAQFTGS